MTTKPVDTDLREFVRLDLQKRELEDALEKTKVGLKDLEPRVIEYFGQMGIDRVAIDGVTLYVRRELWAGKVDDAQPMQVKQAFDEAELDEYCQPRLNHQSFSAYVREIEKQNLPEGGKSLTPEEIMALLPAALQPIVKISETFKVGSRRSS